VSSAVMPSPCNNCPFLREGGIRLHPDRADELAYNACNPHGQRFACHKSLSAIDPDFEVDEDGDGLTQLDVIPEGVLDCAGSAILGLHQHNMTQYLRVMSRIGQFNPYAFSKADMDRVFDEPEQMIEANEDAANADKKRRSK